MITEDQVLSGIASLPTISPVLSQVMELANDIDASASDMEQIILSDPALTANLLRIANSAFYGVSREIVAVRQAVVLLGTRKVAETAVTAALANVLPSHIPGYELSASEFWRHCIAVGVFSDRLATATHLPQSESAFTSGLLHDIGKLVSGLLLAPECKHVIAWINTNQAGLNEAERHVLGMDHTEVGATLAAAWHLPDSVRAAIRWHHEPDQAADHVELARVVHVADCLAHMLGFGTDVGELSRTVAPQVLERMGLPLAELERHICEAMDTIVELSAMLDHPTEGVA
jgi:putative nucleotidyltransferase with HDIG domain